MAVAPDGLENVKEVYEPVQAESQLIHEPELELGRGVVDAWVGFSRHGKPPWVR